MLNLIFLQFAIIRNKLRNLTFLDELKASILLLVGLIFFSWIYFAAWRMLYHLNAVNIAGPLLVNKLMALVFVVSFSMIIFSGLITSFNTIYSSKDLEWLIVSPIKLKSIFGFKALMSSFYASWMVFVTLCPFIFALGEIKGAGLKFYLMTGALMVPFMFLAGLCGVVISLFLVRFFPYRRTRNTLLFLGIVFITVIYILFRYVQPERLVKPDGMEIIAQYLEFLNAPTAVYLPSWWITAGIYSILSKNTGDYIFYLSLLAGTTAALLMIILGLAERFYYTGWAENRVSPGRTAQGAARSYAARGRFGALLQKDFKIFLRDANQWTQLLVLGALVIVYLFSIYKLPLETMYLQNLISFFNVGLIGFIMSAVALRFVFPSLSLEGKSLLFIKSAPLTPALVLKEKLVFGGIPVILLGLVLAGASNILLKTDAPIFWVSIAATLVMAAGLSSLAVGFGFVFPRFDITNVTQIESSAGGLFYMVTALFYLALSISLWAIPMQNFYLRKFGQPFMSGYFWWIAGAILIVNLAATVVPLWLGFRSIRELEI